MRVLILLFLFFYVGSTFGQRSLYYFSFEGKLGDYNGFLFSSTYNYKNEFSASYIYNNSSKKIVKSLLSSSGKISVNTTAFYDVQYLSIGKIIKLGEKGARINANLGLGYADFSVPDNFRVQSRTKTSTIGFTLFILTLGQFPAPTSYTQEYVAYDRVKSRSTAILISPKIEIPLSSIFALSFSPNYQYFSGQHSEFNFTAGLQVGFVRERNRKKN